MTRPFASRFESARPVRGVVPRLAGRAVAVGEAESFTTRDDLIARMDAMDAAWGALAWSVNSFFKQRFAGDVYPKDVDQFSPEQAKRLQQDTTWFLSFAKAVQSWQEFSKGHSTAAWWLTPLTAGRPEAGNDLPAMTVAIGEYRAIYDAWQVRAGADYGVVPRKMLPGAPEEDSNFLLWAGGAVVLGAGGFAAYKIHEKYFSRANATSEKSTPDHRDSDIVIESDET